MSKSRSNKTHLITDDRKATCDTQQSTSFETEQAG